MSNRSDRIDTEMHCLKNQQHTREPNRLYQTFFDVNSPTVVLERYGLNRLFCEPQPMIDLVIDTYDYACRIESGSGGNNCDDFIFLALYKRTLVSTYDSSFLPEYMTVWTNTITSLILCILNSLDYPNELNRSSES